MSQTAGYEQFEGQWGPNARLARDTIAMLPTAGIATFSCHLMDIALSEKLAGHAPGDYVREPASVYADYKRAIGVCFLDQYLPDNALSMGDDGFGASAHHGATTGAEEVVLDGIRIDSPEAVIEHMEQVVFPELRTRIENTNPADPQAIADMIRGECEIQRHLGCDILKGPYGCGAFPCFRYGAYGYVPYFMAYALYPEVMEQDFALQADWAQLHNRIVARAIIEGGLPRLIRLDHDMADARGTLVRMNSLENLWAPHFARSLQPLLDVGIRLIWHCDGNLMQMVPILLEAGVTGFQGFQYEHGMDYPKICKMTGRNGEPLLIVAGVSVTTTLPFGSKADVINQMRWLVENGPQQGLFLGASSSIAPNTNRENIRTFFEGLRHYRENGRTKL